MNKRVFRAVIAYTLAMQSYCLMIYNVTFTLTHNNTGHWLDEAFLPTEAAVLGEVILLIPIPSSDLD